MSTMNGPHPCRLAPRLLSVAWAMALAVLLGACGPGVGGTGTGDTPSALDHFGASAAALCDSELAPLLSCPAGGGVGTPTAGAAPLDLADAAAQPSVVLRLRDDGVDLSAPCVPLQFRGQWGMVPGQPGRFYGYTDPDTAAAPATLDTLPSGAGLVLTLRDAAGRVLLGPVRVDVQPAPPAAAQCP